MLNANASRTSNGVKYEEGSEFRKILAIPTLSISTESRKGSIEMLSVANLNNSNLVFLLLTGAPGDLEPVLPLRLTQAALALPRPVAP